MPETRCEIHRGREARRGNEADCGIRGCRRRTDARQVHAWRGVAERGPDNVIFTGQIKSVEVIVSASDIGVLLNYGEGLPNSVIEYVAPKKPVIATDAGRTNELVVHGNGLQDEVMSPPCLDRKLRQAARLARSVA